MKLSRQQFWLLLQAVVIAGFLLYQALWLTAVPTTGTVVSIEHFKSVKSAQIKYWVDDAPHYTWTIIDGDFSKFRLGQELQISYLPFARNSARVKGVTADMMIVVVWYIIFLLISAAVFIMPNYILEKKCSFIILKKPPFVKYVVEEPILLQAISKSSCFHLQCRVLRH